MVGATEWRWTCPRSCTARAYGLESSPVSPSESIDVAAGCFAGGGARVLVEPNLKAVKISRPFDIIIDSSSGQANMLSYRGVLRSARDVMIKFIFLDSK